MPERHAYLFVSSLTIAMILQGCGSDGSREKQDAPAESGLSITEAPFGDTEEGTANLYTLTNKHGMTVKITNYGGIVVSLTAPDRSGEYADVTLGFNSFEPYLEEHPYFGAIIGRYGNRIGNGTFSLDGQEYSLARNNNGHHLHGGERGFDKRLWAAQIIEDEKGPALELTRRSEHMEEGYPGNMDVVVTYHLDNENSLVINYEATTDQKTICNLTNHTYFNLKGPGKGDILEHALTINASRYTPVDEGLIPTGSLDSVEGTPFEFRGQTMIGSRIDEDDPQLQMGGGYDHNFVLDRETEGEMLQLAARVYEYSTGRVMEVYTTEPGIQFYSGNFLDGSISGKGATYDFRSGFCLETQHWPDSPNKPDWPTVVLEPGETYHSTTIYRFSAR